MEVPEQILHDFLQKTLGFVPYHSIAQKITVFDNGTSSLTWEVYADGYNHHSGYTLTEAIESLGEEIKPEPSVGCIGVGV